MYSEKGMLEKIITDDEIKLISFDIFDTLLFRTVKKPQNVFKLLAEAGKKEHLIPEYSDDYEFMRIRIESESRALKCNNYKEVNINQIYMKMPSIIKNTDRLMKLEIEVEKEACYLNPTIQKLIYELKKLGKKIIFTSDMYLSKKQVTDILIYNDFDISMIDEIYISSEHDMSKKKNGELYKKVLLENKVQANEMIHIGDNFYSDVIEARNIGIKTIYYDVISSKKNNELSLEDMICKDNVAEEVYALRKFVASLDNDLGDEENKWFRLGALCFGPLFSCAAEWMLDIAEENGIKNIYPLMRDGEFLGKLIDQAKEYRKSNINVNLIYISRMSALLPSIEELNENTLDKILYTYDFMTTVKDIFEIFNIDNLGAKFSKYYSLTMKETHTIKIKDKCLYDEIKEFLLSDNIKILINKVIDEESKKLFDYLSQAGMDKKSIILDVGYKGTLQAFINKLFKKNNINSENINLLLIGHFDAIKSLFTNIDLRGYVGSFGKNEKLISQFYKSIPIFDQLVMSDKGTTIGYERGVNGIEPILFNVDYPNKNQLKNVKWFQKGVLEFQKHYLRLIQKKTRVKNLKHKEDEVFELASRVISLPTLNEVDMLGNLYHDENFIAKKFIKICRDDDKKQLKEQGIDEFLMTVDATALFWIEGLITEANPTYYIQRNIKDDTYIYSNKINKLISKIIYDNVKRVVICGAGELGRKILEDIRMCTNIEVEAFVDNNKKLWGSVIDEVPIVPIDSKFISKVYIIASVAYADEISENLINKKGNESIIYKL